MRLSKICYTTRYNVLMWSFLACRWNKCFYRTLVPKQMTLYLIPFSETLAILKPKLLSLSLSLHSNQLALWLKVFNSCGQIEVLSIVLQEVIIRSQIMSIHKDPPKEKNICLSIACNLVFDCDLPSSCSLFLLLSSSSLKITLL
jgi:hypothetical protein